MRQGIIRFSGVNDFISGSFTLTAGVTPSTASLDIPIQSTPIPKIGTLAIAYDGPPLVFPFATVDKIEPVGDAQGRVTWRLTILDRRWIWRETGRISGFYNTDKRQVERARRGSPRPIPSVKLLRDLLQLCLDALNESEAEISPECNGLEDLYLPVEWDYTRPAEALADLCDRSANLVTLGLDNVVRIVPAGRGQELPQKNIIDAQFSNDPAEVPDNVVIVGEPDQFQVDLELEPVGPEIDGTIKPIDQLSYAPQVNGEADWSENDIFIHPRVAADYRELARDNVWKLYRPKATITLPGENPPVEYKPIEFLPLIAEQVETYENEDGEEVPRPAWVYGRFSPLEDKLEGKAVVEPKLSNQPDGLHRGGFSIDAERALVRFNQPVVLLEKGKRNGQGGAGASGLYYYPADIRLRCSVRINRDGYQGPYRSTWFESETVGDSDARPEFVRYVLAEDLLRTVHEDFEQDRIVDNYGELTAKARAKWLLIVEEYQAKTQAQSASYAGFLPIPVDGAVAQVSWQVDGSGRATTRASRNREEVLIAPTYRERRLFERLKADQRPTR